MACRSEVVTDEGAFHKFISIAALHTATEHLACPLTLSLRQALVPSSLKHKNFMWCYLRVRLGFEKYEKFRRSVNELTNSRSSSPGNFTPRPSQVG